MSDDDAPAPPADHERVAELMAAYSETLSRKERWKIEQEVLEATVWRIADERKYELSKDELEYLREQADEERAKAILRRPFVE